MARSVNKVFLVGNVGKIDVRAANNGNTVVSISLATDESYNDRTTGAKVEKTEWHRAVVFGKLAEICAQYVTVGTKVHIEGKLQTREYEKDGVKRYATEIIINDLVLLGGGQNQGQQPQNGHQMQQQAYQQQQQFNQPQQGQQQNYAQGNQQQGYQQQQGQQMAQQQNNFNSFDDDIPF